MAQILLSASERKIAELLVEAEDVVRMVTETPDPRLKTGLAAIFEDRMNRVTEVMQRTGANVVQAGVDYVRAEIMKERARVEKKRRAGIAQREAQKAIGAMERVAQPARPKVQYDETLTSVFDGIEFA